MITLRCTQRLLGRLRASLSADEFPPTNTLGDWYANIIASRPKALALCTNERTLLSVVVPIAPSRDFVSRFRDAALKRVQQIPVPAALRLEETGAFTELRLHRTRSRSVLASMNQLGFGAQVWLRERPSGDLEELGLWVCDTPCSALETLWPWKEAVLLLTGRRRMGPPPPRPSRGNPHLPAPS